MAGALSSLFQRDSTRATACSRAPDSALETRQRVWYQCLVRTPLRLALSILTGVCAAAVQAGPAFADSASLVVLDAAGKNDPVQDVGRVFVFRGQATGRLNLYVKYRPSGGAPCAPSPSTDSGTTYGSSFGLTVNGAFEIKSADTWRSTGDVQFCMWLSNSNSTPSQPYPQVVRFREPRGTVRLVAIGTPRANRPGAVRVFGTSEAPRTVYVKARNAGGAGCAPTASEDSGNTIGSSYGESVNGAFNTRHTITWGPASAAQFCLYLAKSSSEIPIGGRPVRVIVRMGVRSRPTGGQGGKTRTSVSVTATPRIVLFGQSVAIHGEFSGVKGGKAMLQAFTGGVWVGAKAITIKADGSFFTTLKPAQRGTYRFRIAYAGDRTRAPAVSKVLSITVK